MTVWQQLKIIRSTTFLDRQEALAIEQQLLIGAIIAYLLYHRLCIRFGYLSREEIIPSEAGVLIRLSVFS